MADKLDYQEARHLLEEADRKWFASHSAGFNYQEHLDFVADYIVKHYGKRERGSRNMKGGRGGIR